MQYGSAIYLHKLGPNRTKVFAYLRELLKLSVKEVGEVPKSLPYRIIEGTDNEVLRVKRSLEALGCKVQYGPL
jgi:ribosomal protein L7/L12